MASILMELRRVAYIIYNKPTIMPASSFIAKAETIINTGIDKVWNALVNPDVITKYMFGAKVQSGWKKGSKITWKGEWQGKAYEDKGEILEIIPGRKLQYSHFSPLTGLEDKPENYHVVTIDLTEKDHQTRVSLSQDNNETAEAQKHSEKNWAMMLESLKKLVEEIN